jgi:hypothetical protein
MLMRPNPGVRGPKVGSPDTAKKELRKLAGKAKALIKVLDDLSQTALHALNYRQATLGELKTRLRILHATADAREVNADIAKSKRRTEPRKVQIARVVAQHYYGLTGQKPTRRVKWDDGRAYGPFLELLNAVYGILDIKASADAVIKSGAIAAMEFSQQKSSN